MGILVKNRKDQQRMIINYITKMRYKFQINNSIKLKKQPIDVRKNRICY